MSLVRPPRVVMGLSLLIAIAGHRADAQDPRGPDRPPPGARLDMGSLTREIMAIEADDAHQFPGIWMPLDVFVRLHMEQTGRDPADAPADLDLYKNYVVIIAGELHIRDGNARVHANGRDLEDRTTLTPASGAEFSRVRRPPPKIAALSEELKATFVDVLGEFGKNLQVLVFDAKAGDGETRFEPGKKNTPSLAFKSRQSFKASQPSWRTPLDAVNPIPPCQRCSQPISAKWSFCPWCGAKIEGP